MYLQMNSEDLDPLFWDSGLQPSAAPTKKHNHVVL